MPRDYKVSYVDDILEAIAKRSPDLPYPPYISILVLH